jgi:tetratricopeptide (TPR) repeat protein
LVSQPAVDAATSGCIVVAAAGNYLHTLSVPAVCPEVLGAAFEREKRTVTDTIEIAESGAPTYTPSDFTDFAIIQPENVLGSSFATPLLVGFATLMNQPTDLDPFRDMVRNGGLASELLAASSANAAPWTDRQRDVVIELYEQAMAVRPHVNDSGPCPECALFAVPTYIDYGLLRLNLGDLDAAERLTMQARIVAPGNAFAAANLGVIYGAQADRATRGGELSAATGLLDAAITHMGAAVSIRPDYPPYARRLGEFTTARLDPQNWTMRR